MTPTRTTLTLVGTTAALSAALAVLPPPAFGFGDGSFAGSLLRGSAHGGSVRLGNTDGTVVKAGPVAPQSLGCNPVLGATGYTEAGDAGPSLNYVAIATVPIPSQVNALQAKEIRNSGYATANDAQAEVLERSTSSDVNLLGGRVTATSLEETAHTTLSDAGYLNEASITFQDLVLDRDGSGPQQPVVVPDPAPNTTYQLPGIGQVVFNEQLPDATGITANAIHLQVTDFGGFSGDIYVAHVQTQVSKAPARISGFAFGTQAKAAPVASSGKQALVNLPCSGTGEKDKVVSAAGLVVQGADPGSSLLSTATSRDTVNGKTSKSSPYSRSTSRVESVRLLVDPSGSARVTADAVEVKAYTFGGFDRLQYDQDGTKSWFTGVRSVGSLLITNLRVDGTPVDATVPGEPIDVAGLGKLYVNEQRCSDARTGGSSSCASDGPDGDTHYSQITVTGLHLVVTVANNAAGLPVGAEVLVAVAHSDLSF